MEERNAWDRRPDETAKAFRAFTVYLGLIDHADARKQSRSIKATADKMGYSSPSTLEEWSSKYDWVARSQAYDNYMANRVVVYTETALKEYQDAVVSSLSAQLIQLNRIIDTSLEDAQLMQEYARNNTDVEGLSPSEVKRLVESVKLKDDLARRLGKMATTFRREDEVDTMDDDTVYIIGGEE